MAPWQDIVRRIKNPKGEVTIGIVGKYVDLEDSYKSLNEALVARRHRQRREGGSRRWIEVGRARPANAAETARGRRRHPRARRLRQPGHRREDRGHPSTPARPASPTSASVSACSARSSSSRATSAALPSANSTEFDADTKHRVIYMLEDQLRRRRQGRHDAARRLRLPAQARHAGGRDLRRHRGQRAPSPPLRVQQASTGARSRATGWSFSRNDTRRQARRDRRAPRPPVVRRLPVPPGVQVASRSRRIRCSTTSCARASRAATRAARPCVRAEAAAPRA